MKKFKLVLFALLALFIITPTIVCAGNYWMKRSRVKSLVYSAIKYYKRYGKNQAFAAFSDRSGKFVRGNLYVFVYNYNGVCKASGGNPRAVGKNQLMHKDRHGNYPIQLLIRKAKKGGGWVTYFWKNPTTKRIEPKISFVKPLGRKLLIGSGYYIK